MTGPLPAILLVEDNDDDVLITKRALARVGVPNPIVVVRDGDEALATLRGKTSGLPCLVLLDLNLPRVDGFEVLRAMKGDPQLRAIPVVVLTTSRREADILRCYDGHANSYIAKPVEFDGFVEAIRSLHRFWNLTATPPPAKKPEEHDDEAAAADEAA